MEHLVYLTKILEGNNKYHLLFYGYIHMLNPNKEYYFDYTGTDIETDAPLTDLARENLIKCLEEDFKYAPFDFENSKLIFGESKSYNIQLW